MSPQTGTGNGNLAQNPALLFSHTGASGKLGGSTDAPATNPTLMPPNNFRPGFGQINAGPQAVAMFALYAAMSLYMTLMAQYNTQTVNEIQVQTTEAQAAASATQTAANNQASGLYCQMGQAIAGAVTSLGELAGTSMANKSNIAEMNEASSNAGKLTNISSSMKEMQNSPANIGVGGSSGNEIPNALYLRTANGSRELIQVPDENSQVPGTMRPATEADIRSRQQALAEGKFINNPSLNFNADVVKPETPGTPTEQANYHLTQRAVQTLPDAEAPGITENQTSPAINKALDKQIEIQTTKMNTASNKMNSVNSQAQMWSGMLNGGFQAISNGLQAKYAMEQGKAQAAEGLANTTAQMAGTLSGTTAGMIDKYYQAAEQELSMLQQIAQTATPA